MAATLMKSSGTTGTSKAYARLYPDLSQFMASSSTSTLEKKAPVDFDMQECRTPLEPSAPPADIVSHISAPDCPPPAKPRSKADLHRWSQWRSRLNEEMADFLKGSRQDVTLTDSLEEAFPGRRMDAIYNHAVTEDSPSTCLASVPYLLYGIPRVKRANLLKHGHDAARIHWSCRCMHMSCKFSDNGCCRGRGCLNTPWL